MSSKIKGMETQQTKQLSKKERKHLKQLEKMEKKKKTKRIKLYRGVFFWTFVALVIMGTIWGIIEIVKKNTNSFPINIQGLNDNDWIKGNRSAKVVIVEYSDFQCPACASYVPLLTKLLEDFKDDISLVYRHFPLPNHKNAKGAAYAAEAAGKQGKFWEMHNLIFEKQTEWSKEKNPDNLFENYARVLGLDTNKFSSDFKSEEIKNKVEESYQGAVILRLNYTPTFFLNGQKIENPRSYEDFKKIIQEKINENS